MAGILSFSKPGAHWLQESVLQDSFVWSCPVIKNSLHNESAHYIMDNFGT
jgi:hypothetical protein